MPVYKREVEEGEAPEVEIVTVRVTDRGHGKISTGKHDAKEGEEYFAEGETFRIARDIAEELIGDRKALSPKLYVEIVPEPKAKPEKAAV